ncbi:hypothetical protein DdX_08128 [Ditylenchus destructor]|uniref:Uncharacterized protein n=1 Tax=Ditylenchus destructor TaxID=166010 RepID=A0AAD4N5Z0_9BILA|nr:hypothetical protein DdX_08128 [Ditylenchus destructor]
MDVVLTFSWNSNENRHNISSQRYAKTLSSDLLLSNPTQAHSFPAHKRMPLRRQWKEMLTAAIRAIPQPILNGAHITGKPMAKVHSTIYRLVAQLKKGQGESPPLSNGTS